jgi:hypothetical protein
MQVDIAFITVNYNTLDCVLAEERDFRKIRRIRPPIREIALATCALDSPRIHGGLIRIISTRRRATPVRIR